MRFAPVVAVGLAFSLAMAARGKEAKPPKLGESFTLRVGQTVDVEDADIQVTFEGVSSDSRCPKDVTCIQAGKALVHLAIASSAGDRSVLKLEVPPGGESVPASFGNLLVTILELHPQKESGKPTDPSAYVATITFRQA